MALFAFPRFAFMSTLMDNSMVAQNTCLQMSVIGRNTFIGRFNLHRFQLALCASAR
jgi:hypothetical protein